jgi:hypothetical protein
MTIETYQPAAVAVPVTRDVDSWTQVAGDVIKLASEIANTPFVPDGLRGSVPATAAAMLTARELGLPPMTGLANIHVIKGKPGLSALLMRALIQSQGHEWQDGEVTDTRAVVRARRRGESEWTEATFTADQAKRAGIALGGYPQDKLYARATARLARRKFADVIAGMPYSAEELADGDMPADEAPAPTSTPAAPKRRTARRSSLPSAASPSSGGVTEVTPAQRAAAPVAEPVAPPLPGEDGYDEPAEVEAVESVPDEHQAEEQPKPVTRQQLTKLHASLGELGVDNRADKLEACGLIVGRSLSSSSDMTRDEASRVIDTLSNLLSLPEPRVAFDELYAACVERQIAEGGLDPVDAVEAEVVDDTTGES